MVTSKNCDNCDIKLDRLIYCGVKCKMAYRRKLLKVTDSKEMLPKVTDSVTKSNKLIEALPIVTKPIRKGECMHRLKMCSMCKE